MKHTGIVLGTAALALAGILLKPASADDPGAAGPNLLIDVSAGLIDAAVRRPVDRTEPIEDVILDTPICGRTRTVAAARAELIPDPCRGAVDVVLDGCVYAQTVGTRQFLRLYTTSTTPFEVRRRVLIDARGFCAVPGPSWARALATLEDVTTRDGDADGAVTVIARAGFLRDKQAAEAESSAKTVARAAANLAGELTGPLATGSQAVARALYGFQQAGLKVEALDFSTTPAYLETRLRVAAPRAGPPPTLPPDTDLGLRIHQGLVNEAARSALGGKTIRLDEIVRTAETLTATFLRDGRSDSAQADGLQTLRKLLKTLNGQAASITLAADDPVAVTFTDGGLTIEVHLSAIRLDAVDLPGARVRAAYRVDNPGGRPRALRQGPVQLSPAGPRTGKPLPPPLGPVLDGVFDEVLKARFTLPDLALPPAAADLPLPQVHPLPGWLLVTWRRPPGDH